VKALRGLVVPLAILVAGQAYFMLTRLHSDAIAPPSDVVMSGLRAIFDGTILGLTGATIVSTLGGLAIGVACGILLGVVLGSVRVLDRLLEFTIEAIRPVPSVALIPVALLAFGFGYRLEMSIVAFACVWPVFLMTRAAVTGIPRALLDVGSVLQLSPMKRFRSILLPAALPTAFVGIRLAAGFALTVAVTVEITTNPLGIGYGVMRAQQELRPGLMLALIVWVGLLGWALNGLLNVLQRHLRGNVPATAVFES
jgi:ABC-type nitrate/sulfonate/bicarbonate transport system permease component